MTVDTTADEMSVDEVTQKSKYIGNNLLHSCIFKTFFKKRQQASLMLIDCV